VIGLRITRSIAALLISATSSLSGCVSTSQTTRSVPTSGSVSTSTPLGIVALNATTFAPGADLEVRFHHTAPDVVRTAVARLESRGQGTQTTRFDLHAAIGGSPPAAYPAGTSVATPTVVLQGDGPDRYRLPIAEPGDYEFCTYLYPTANAGQGSYACLPLRLSAG